MKPYIKQELEACSFFSKMFSGKPTENAWKEINNILADAQTAQELTSDKVKEALKSWSAKFDEQSLNQRSGIYRKLADVIYTEAMTTDDALFAQGKHLAEVLELPPHLVKMADKGAKTAAYFVRCRAILEGTEKLTINEINAIFGYDYEDGLSVRKQVFQDYFNLKFEEISSTRRYTPEQEAELRSDCKKLDVPYEFKNNIENALDQYRSLWNAENHDVQPMEVNIPLEKGEKCLVYANCGLCEHKVIETEDNYYELTRKFRIDETVSFQGDHIQHPTIKEETNVLLELGYFFLTTERIIYLGQKLTKAVALSDITGADFDGMNMVTYHTKNGDVMFKYSDESAEVLYIIFNRVIKGDVKIK